MSKKSPFYARRAAAVDRIYRDRVGTTIRPRRLGRFLYLSVERNWGLPRIRRLIHKNHPLPDPPTIVNGQFLYNPDDPGDVSSKHSMLITAYPEVEQIGKIDRIKALGHKSLALCVGYNSGDNPFHESHHKIDIRKPWSRRRIVHGVGYAESIGLGVTPVMGLDDSDDISIDRLKVVIDRVGQHVGDHGLPWWLLLEGDEDYSPDDHHELGLHLASVIGDPILAHFSRELWSPHDADVDSEIKRDWWDEATEWCDGLALQSNLPLGQVRNFCESVRGQLDRVDRDLRLVWGESDRDCTTAQKAAIAQAVQGDDACEGSYDGLLAA
tara:strand:- start:41378 stop:42352 length:975 start_codon:yes stop_codon:yes gene_type:complete